MTDLATNSIDHAGVKFSSSLEARAYLIGDHDDRKSIGARN